jgi:thiamine-phosphate pyrophosphorylase
VPYVAIGGIGVASAAAIVRDGAAGIAVVSAIGAADDPRKAARALRAEIDRERPR